MYKQAIAWIKANAEKHGDAAILMRRAGANKPSWYKLLQGRDVRAESFLTWLDNLGFRLVEPGEKENLREELGSVNLPDSSGSTSDLQELLALRKRSATLEGQLALLQGLYEKALGELTDMKAERRYMQRVYGIDSAQRDFQGGVNSAAYGLAQETPAKYEAERKEE